MAYMILVLKIHVHLSHIYLQLGRYLEKANIPESMTKKKTTQTRKHLSKELSLVTIGR